MILWALNMTKPSVYVETSIASYPTARPSRDLIIAAPQATPRNWWRDAPERFALVASEFVFPQVADGDADTALARLTAPETVTRLDTAEDASALTRKLLELGAFPCEVADAAHIGIATTNRVER